VKPLVTRPSTVQFTAGSATLGLVVAATVVTAAGPWDSTGQRTAEREWAASQGRAGGADHGHVSGTSGKAPAPAPSAASVLTGLGGSVGAGPSPTEKALADVLGPLLGDAALGTERAAAVVDLATGKRLYGKGAGDALTPASTTKIATAVAALTAAGADHRIATRTVLEPDSRKVVLVGGGDPTLTARKDAQGNASLRTLADRTARALKDRKTDEVTLSYDTSLYEGPDVHPIGLDNTNVARVTALMADEGRLDDTSSGTAKRTEDPAADAAKKFADLLKDRGIKTADPAPAKATDRAKALAAVKSPPLSALVERMLTNSDNDIAEALARQTAVAAHEPASFKGGGAATRKQLKKARTAPQGRGVRRRQRPGPRRQAHRGPAHRPAGQGRRPGPPGAARRPHGPAGGRFHRHPERALRRPARHRPRTRQDGHPDRRTHPGGHGRGHGRPPPGLRLPDSLRPTHRADGHPEGPGRPGVNPGDLRLQLIRGHPCGPLPAPSGSAHVRLTA
jgi:hypothetical protein